MCAALQVVGPLPMHYRRSRPGNVVSLELEPENASRLSIRQLTVFILHPPRLPVARLLSISLHVLLVQGGDYIYVIGPRHRSLSRLDWPTMCRFVMVCPSLSFLSHASSFPLHNSGRRLITFQDRGPPTK
jgi:hypothetical protein